MMEDFYDYIIKWDVEGIVWMVDNVIICILCVFCVKVYFIKLGYFYGYFWDVFVVVMVGKINWYNVLFFMSFGNL